MFHDLTIRRLATGTLLLVAALSNAACAASMNVSCAAGRTAVDGVCIDESVADYVMCVRAHGSMLDEARRDELEEKIPIDARGADPDMQAIIAACKSTQRAEAEPSGEGLL
jgi:hypothetical protein